MKQVISKYFSNFRLSYSEDKIKTLLYYACIFFISISFIITPLFTTTTSKSLTTVVNIFSIVTSVCILCYIVFRGHFVFNYYAVFLILFVVYSTIISLFNQGFTTTLRTTILLYGYIFFLFEFFANIKRIDIFKWIIIISVISFSLGFLIVNFKDLFSGKRLGGNLGNENTVCDVLAVGFLFLIDIALKNKKKFLLFLIPAGLLLIEIILTGSRGGLFSWLVASLVYLFFIYGKKHPIKYLALVLCIIGLIVLMLQIPAFESYKKHFELMFETIFNPSLSYTKDGSTTTRINMFIDGFVLSSKNLIFGYGTEGFKNITSYGTYSHSNIVEVLTSFGLIGMFLHFFPPIFCGIKISKNKNKLPARDIVNSLLVFFILSSIYSVKFTDKVFNLYFLFIFCFEFIINEKCSYSVEIGILPKPKATIHLSEELKFSSTNDSIEAQSYRILVIVRNFSSGGAERVASILTNKWKENNEVLVVSTDQNCVEKYEGFNGVNCKIFPSNYRNNLFSKHRWIKRVAKAFKPSVIIAFTSVPSILGCWVANDLTIPFITSERNDPSQKSKSFKEKVTKFLKNISYRYAKCVVFQNDYAKSKFSKNIRKNSSVIPNPVILKSNLDNKKIEKRIVGVGRFTEQKDFSTLINAFNDFSKSHKDYILEVYGNGLLENKLKDESLINPKIKILPFNENIHEIILNSSVLVSSSKFEGMPNVVLEAICLGVPVVATDCPVYTLRTILSNNKFSYLVPVGDSNGIAVKLGLIVEDYKKYREGAEILSKEYIKMFDAKIISNQWIEVIKKVIE